jgi:nuclear pore complex protein Nup205
MAEMNSLESLQALHTDLVALTESRLLNVERLGMQLEAHIQDFRALLDRKFRNEQSRQKLATGIDDDLSVIPYTFVANSRVYRSS